MDSWIQGTIYTSTTLTSTPYTWPPDALSKAQMGDNKYITYMLTDGDYRIAMILNILMIQTDIERV